MCDLFLLLFLTPIIRSLCRTYLNIPNICNTCKIVIFFSKTLIFKFFFLFTFQRLNVFENNIYFLHNSIIGVAHMHRTHYTGSDVHRPLMDFRKPLGVTRWPKCTFGQYNNNYYIDSIIIILCYLFN